MSAGVHVLWSAAGRKEYVITGPFELGAAYDSEEFVQTLEAPEGMNYQPGEFVVVTLLVFSQYPAVVCFLLCSLIGLFYGHLIPNLCLFCVTRVKLATPCHVPYQRVTNQALLIRTRL